MTDKKHALVVGCDGDFENVRTVTTPEELADLMGWTVSGAAMWFNSSPAVPCFILPSPEAPEPEVAERTDEKLRNIILDTATDAGSRFAYYDRKDDYELSADDLHDAVCRGVVTVDEIVEAFRDETGLDDLDDDAEAVTVEGVPRP